MANNYRKTSKPHKKHRNTRRNTLGGSSKLLPHEQLKLDLEDIRRGTLRIDGSRPHELPWEKSKREHKEYLKSMGLGPGKQFIYTQSTRPDSTKYGSVKPYTESKHTASNPYINSKQHTASKPHPNSKPPTKSRSIFNWLRKSRRTRVAPEKK